MKIHITLFLVLIAATLSAETITEDQLTQELDANRQIWLVYRTCTLHIIQPQASIKALLKTWPGYSKDSLELQLSPLIPNPWVSILMIEMPLFLTREALNLKRSLVGFYSIWTLWLRVVHRKLRHWRPTNSSKRRRRSAPIKSGMMSNNCEKNQTLCSWITPTGMANSSNQESPSSSIFISPTTRLASIWIESGSRWAQNWRGKWELRR